MVIKLANAESQSSGTQGVRIIWKGTRIAKLILSSGKVIEFSN